MGALCLASRPRQNGFRRLGSWHPRRHRARSVFACCEARRDRKRRELSNQLIRLWSRNRIAATVRIDDRFLAVPRQPQPHGSRNHGSSVRREPRGNCPVERRHSLIIEPCRNWSAHGPPPYQSYTIRTRLWCVGAPPPSLRQGQIERPGGVGCVGGGRQPTDHDAQRLGRFRGSPEPRRPRADAERRRAPPPVDPLRKPNSPGRQTSVKTGASSERSQSVRL